MVVVVVVVVGVVVNGDKVSLVIKLVLSFPVLPSSRREKERGGGGGAVCFTFIVLHVLL